MKLDPNKIKHIAKLANFDITEPEANLFAQQLSAVLDYVDHLEKAPTDSIQPLFNVNESKNVFREDKVVVGLTQEECLKNAPSTYKGYFKVKSIF